MLFSLRDEQIAALLNYAETASYPARAARRLCEANFLPSVFYHEFNYSAEFKGQIRQLDAPYREDLIAHISLLRRRASHWPDLQTSDLQDLHGLEVIFTAATLSFGILDWPSAALPPDVDRLVFEACAPPVCTVLRRQTAASAILKGLGTASICLSIAALVDGSSYRDLVGWHGKKRPPWCPGEPLCHPPPPILMADFNVRPGYWGMHYFHSELGSQALTPSQHARPSCNEPPN